MDTLQDIRYKLQKRVNRLKSSSYQTFTEELVRFWDFFDRNSTLALTGSQLAAKFPEVGKDIDSYRPGSEIIGQTEEAQAAVGYEVLRRTAAGKHPQRLDFLQFVVSRAFDKALDTYVTRYLEPFYEYIDEHLQDANIVLAQLVRFKRVAEWFRRNELLEAFQSESARGERILGFKLYEFLYMQGIEIAIEPTSASGEADMIALQDPKNPLVADVKIFDPLSSRGHAYIAKGIGQVHRYLSDFNKAIGYLVVFKVADREIKIEGSVGDPALVESGSKRIYVIAIDIFKHERTASKRGEVEFETVSSAEINDSIEG